MATLDDDLLGIVNKLQDLVFNTIGNDSLDLPQIVRPSQISPLPSVCETAPYLPLLQTYRWWWVLNRLENLSTLR